MSETFAGSTLVPQAVGLTQNSEEVGVAPVESSVADIDRDPLAKPEGAVGAKASWGAIGVITSIHSLALVAVLPQMYSWTALVAALVGWYVFACLGINVCFHRLLTHRGFKTYGWMEKFLSMLAFCNLEGSSVRWVATHRMHHKHSDHRPDPHSPLVNFFWGHVGWMLIDQPATNDPKIIDRYAGDLLRQPFHKWMHEWQRWLLVWLVHVGIVMGIGAAVEGWRFGSRDAALWGALQWLVWGVGVRSVMVWHVTWAINSVTHLWGYRNYKTTDESRNNWLFGLLAFGEGWHNNHHADQRSVAHGHRWWEVDIAYMTVRVMRMFGLAWDLILPARNEGTLHDPSLRSQD